MGAVTSHEESDARASRTTRLRLALGATAVSVLCAGVVDATDGPARWVAGAAVTGLVVAGGLTLLQGGRLQVATRPPSLDQLVLIVVSLAMAAIAMEFASGWLASWRYTAAAIAATAPNLYTAAANLLPPVPAVARR